jgi:hypothetical protein
MKTKAQRKADRAFINKIKTLTFRTGPLLGKTFNRKKGKTK